MNSENLVLAGIHPATRKCELVGIDDDGSWKDCREMGLIPFRVSVAVARSIFGTHVPSLDALRPQADAALTCASARTAPVEQREGEAVRAMRFALEQLQRHVEALVPECECESCPECGNSPIQCSDTPCAETCQCSLCEHCCAKDAIDGLESALAHQPSQSSSYRDAYEGAREDLLDWRRRAQRAEAELRRLGYRGVIADESPAAMGELPELPEPNMRELNPYKGASLDPYRGADSLQWWSADAVLAYGQACALSARTAPVEGATDEQIIAFCERAGLKWIKPLDEDGDCSAFPGGFDITYMRQMRNLLTATTAPVVGDMDGERYRWLRNHAPDASAVTPAAYFYQSGDGLVLIAGDDLDTALDTARTVRRGDATAEESSVVAGSEDCQSGRADICRAGIFDGVACADGECDIDQGGRPRRGESNG